MSGDVVLSLHLPDRAPVRVRAFIRDGRLTVTNGAAIWFQLSGPLGDLVQPDAAPAQQLDAPVQQPAVASAGLVPATTDRLNPRAAGWEWLTPQMVIDWFKTRPALRAHAADVEQVLAPLVLDQDSDAADPLDQDLAAVAHLELVQDGQLVYGAQARIAEALGIPNAGSHRKRVLAVAELLLLAKSTTTTTPAPVENGEKARSAA